MAPPIDINGPKQPQVLRHQIHVTDNCRLTSRFSSIRPHDSGKGEELAWNSPIFFVLFSAFLRGKKGSKKNLKNFHFFLGAPTNVGYSTVVTTTIVGVNCYDKEKVTGDEPHGDGNFEVSLGAQRSNRTTDP
jgi:hypothetical protein